MLVTCSQDRTGSVTVTPVSNKLYRKYAAHMKEWTGVYDPSAFFQEGIGLPEEITRNRQYRDLENGYDITIRVDSETFGYWLGWDAHEI